jgi:hypothetical protein
MIIRTWEKNQYKQTDANFCSLHSSLLIRVDVTEFQTTDAYSNLDLTNVKYSMYVQPREENLKVAERIRPNCKQQTPDSRLGLTALSRWSLNIASGRFQQKTSLPTIPLSLHDLTIGADPQKTPFWEAFPLVTLHGVTSAVVASLFLVPKSTNGRYSWLKYSCFQLTCHNVKAVT